MKKPQSLKVMPPDPSPTELEQAAELISCLGRRAENRLAKSSGLSLGFRGLGFIGFIGFRGYGFRV